MSDTKTTINNAPFTADEVAAVIKPFLSMFEIRDEAEYIQFKRWNNARHEVTFAFSVGYRETGLFVYLQMPRTAAHYVKSMEELRNALEDEQSGVFHLNMFRNLLGLEAQIGKQNNA